MLRIPHFLRTSPPLSPPSTVLPFHLMSKSTAIHPRPTPLHPSTPRTSPLLSASPRLSLPLSPVFVPCRAIHLHSNPSAHCRSDSEYGQVLKKQKPFDRGTVTRRSPCTIRPLECHLRSCMWKESVRAEHESTHTCVEIRESRAQVESFSEPTTRSANI